MAFAAIISPSNTSVYFFRSLKCSNNKLSCRQQMPVLQAYVGEQADTRETQPNNSYVLTSSTLHWWRCWHCEESRSRHFVLLKNVITSHIAGQKLLVTAFVHRFVPSFLGKQAIVVHSVSLTVSKKQFPKFQMPVSLPAMYAVPHPTDKVIMDHNPRSLKTFLNKYPPTTKRLKSGVPLPRSTSNVVVVVVVVIVVVVVGCCACCSTSPWRQQHRRSLQPKCMVPLVLCIPAMKHPCLPQISRSSTVCTSSTIVCERLCIFHPNRVIFRFYTSSFYTIHFYTSSLVVIPYE